MKRKKDGNLWRGAWETMPNQNSQTPAPRKRKLSKRALIWIITISVLVVAAAGITTAVLYQQHVERVRAEEQAIAERDAALDVDTFYHGVVVAGQDLGGKTREEAKELLEELAPSLREKIDIKLTLEKEERRLTTDDFTFTYDIDDVLDEAYAVAREGDGTSATSR